MEYIRRKNAPIVEKLACGPIYEICVKEELRPGMRLLIIWWG